MVIYSLQYKRGIHHTRRILSLAAQSVNQHCFQTCSVSGGYLNHLLSSSSPAEYVWMSNTIFPTDFVEVSDHGYMTR